MLHNFTLSGKTITFYTITGNLSTSKGTVVYEGLTLTQCLKMESATVISFTLMRPRTLKLVFNDGFVGKVKVDGVADNAVAGILAFELPVGEHKITKGDIANLYNMSVLVPTGVEEVFASQPVVYPNPVSSQLPIASEAVIERVVVYSLGGAQLLQAEGNTQSIDVAQLKPGVYLLVVHTEQGVFKYKIRKQ